MGRFNKSTISLGTLSLGLISALLQGCGDLSSAFLLPATSTSSSFSGYSIVSSGATNGVSLYNPQGEFVRLLSDYNNPIQTPYGVMVSATGTAYMVIDGIDRVDAVDLTTNVVSTPILHAGLTATTLQGGAVDSSGNIYVVEGAATNTIEKFTSDGTRIGSPFIASTTGACVLSTPRYIAVLGNGNIAVTSAANNRLLIYTSAGACVSSNALAPFVANSPYGIAWDAIHSKIIITSNATSVIIATAIDGTGGTTIFAANLTVISAPTAVSVDSSGNLYIANTGLDTVEKLTFNGTTATRATSSPFITASTYLRDPYGIAVVP